MLQLQNQSALNIFKTYNKIRSFGIFYEPVVSDGTMWNNHDIMTNHHFRKQSDCVKQF